jgi:hypothetical protein
VIQELVAAIRTEKLDLLVTEFLIVTVEFALALRAGHPKNLCHSFLLPAQTEKSEIRSTKSETKISQINSNQRKSKP